MSLSSVLRDWCKHHGYKSATAVYFQDPAFSIKEGEARLVRFVSASDRGTKHRSPQTYLLELFVDNTFAYPLGVGPKSQQQLLAAMVADTMERKVQ